MQKKPDLLWILAIIFSLGVVTTGYTQSLWEQPAVDKATATYRAQTILAPHTNPDH
jgi:hypothetical protein